MWEPAETELTVLDEPDREAHPDSTRSLWLRFALLAGGLSAAGWAIGAAGLSIVAQTGLSATIVAVLLTSVSTSLPELITAVAAARAGAPTLAVAGVVGGNTFDILFVAVGDALYRDGSIYEAVDRADIFVIAWTVLLVGIAGAGLIRRQRRGIGFEGVAILAAYVLGVAALTAI